MVQFEMSFYFRAAICTAVTETHAHSKAFLEELKEAKPEGVSGQQKTEKVCCPQNASTRNVSKEPGFQEEIRKGRRQDSRCVPQRTVLGEGFPWPQGAVGPSCGRDRWKQSLPKGRGSAAEGPMES
jgi:uncharacterized protein (DUF2147 family)